MTATTTRHASPAATRRTGRGVAALPNDSGLDAILADPNLSSTAKALVTVMVRNWAWVKDHCWPSDKTLAAKVGKSVGHVQRCLRELELAGRIERERTAEVPNGRRIWLLWHYTGDRAGARRDPAPARTPSTAPARSERVVIVNGGTKLEIRPASRPRPKDDPVPIAVLDAPSALASISRVEESPESSEPLLTAQEVRKTLSEPVTEKILTATAQALSGASGGVLDDPAPAVVPSVPLTASLPLDLGVIGKPMARSSMQPTAPGATTPSPSATTPPTSSAPRRALRRKGLGLTLDELVKVVGETADPILAAELTYRMAPPGPPEPSPQALPTAELFEMLPGRHDLIMIAARRLSEETGDYKAASLRTFERMAEAVATRSVPPSVLIDCWRQGTGPKSEHKGKVLVAAWKREAPMRC